MGGKPFGTTPTRLQSAFCSYGEAKGRAVIKSIVEIPNHRCLSDSSLKAMRKSELIEYIRCLEYNWSVALEFNEQQAKNFADMLNKLSQFAPKGESDRKRCCCNCRHDIRTWDGDHCTNHCEIDGHYIGYVECFEGWCRHWAKDKWQEEGADDDKA